MKRKLRMKLRIFKSVFLLTTSLTVSSITGVKTIKELDDYVNEYYYDILPHGIIDDVQFEDNRFRLIKKYTNEELKEAKEITINLFEGKDYSFLNEMENLEKLVIYDYSIEPVLNNINGNIFNNSLDIEINKMDNKATFSKEKYSFLNDIKDINSLSLCKSPNIESKFLESLTNVHNLKIEVGKTTSLNFQKLFFLDSLYLDGDPYNVAMFVSKDDLFLIGETDMDFKTRDMDTLIKITDQLDSIIKKINIDYRESDEEKIEKIVNYVISNSEYSKEVLENTNYLSKLDMNKFYKVGYLKSFLDNNSHVCENYAATITALLHSLDLESYNLFSKNHCWNMVKLDNNYYYIDASLLDEKHIKLNNSKSNNKILSSNQETFINSEYYNLRDYYEWYLQNPFTTINTVNVLTNNKDETHIPNFVPVDVLSFDKEYLNIAAVNSEKSKEELNEIKNNQDKKLLIKNTSVTLLLLIISKLLYEILLLDIEKNDEIKRKIKEKKI